MSDSEHVITYARNTLSGNWCAKCSCGWVTVNDREPMLEESEAHVAGTLWVEADPHEKVA